MATAYIILSIFYMLACIADGPDVKPRWKKWLGKRLEAMSNSLYPIQYVKRTLPEIDNPFFKRQWKPSDEQITVLELASKYERVFTPKQIDILIDLKEQLKKLKGE